MLDMASIAVHQGSPGSSILESEINMTKIRRRQRNDVAFSGRLVLFMIGTMQYL